MWLAQSVRVAYKVCHTTASARGQALATADACSHTELVAAPYDHFLGLSAFGAFGAAARGTARLPARPFRCPLPLPLPAMTSV